MLSDKELVAIYRAAQTLGYPSGHIILVCIHTAMLRGEVRERVRKFNEVLWFAEVPEERHFFHSSLTAKNPFMSSCSVLNTSMSRQGEIPSILCTFGLGEKSNECHWKNEKFWIKWFVRGVWQKDVTSWKFPTKKKEDVRVPQKGCRRNKLELKSQIVI